MGAIRDLWKAIKTTLDLVFIDPPRNFYKHHMRKRYTSRLQYALSRLLNPHHDDIDERDRKYRIEAVKWLHAYYEGVQDFVADGPPEVKLKKILSKPTRDVTLRDHVYTKVFYYWKEHKRVEGF